MREHHTSVAGLRGVAKQRSTALDGPRSTHAFTAARALLRTSRAMAWVCLLLVWAMTAARAAPTIDAWQMWVPRSIEAQATFQTLQLQLQKFLREPVQMQTFTSPPNIQAPSPGSKPQVFLLLNGSQYGNPQTNPQHLSNLKPIMVFSEMPWCLFANAASRVDEQGNLFEWLQQQPQPVHIGIDAQSGGSMLWARALLHSQAVSTRPALTVKISAFGGAYPLDQIFDKGAALVLAHCWRILNMPEHIAVVAQSRAQSASYVPAVPTFAKLGLPPLQTAWLTAFSDKNASAEDQQRLIHAMERLSLSPEAARALTNMGLTSLRLNHLQSRQYMEDYLRTWQSVSNLLQWDDSRPPSAQAGH